MNKESTIPKKLDRITQYCVFIPWSIFKPIKKNKKTVRQISRPELINLYIFFFTFFIFYKKANPIRLYTKDIALKTK